MPTVVAVTEPAEETTRLVFDPRRAVEVKRDGRWWPGWQSRWVRWTPDSPWRASVTYTTTVGSTYMEDVLAERVRLPASP